MKSFSQVFDGELNGLLREIVESGKTLHLKVISQSMSPLLHIGDVVIVKRTISSECHPGDMIVFEKDDTLTTHRLLTKKESHWLTKGDNALNPDPPLSPDHVLGKVIGIQLQNHIYHMDSASWSTTNRALAQINLAQITSVKFIDKITSILFGKKTLRGVSLLKRLFAIPFRFFSKLLIQSHIKREAQRLGSSD